jgi:hypothetical protein
LTAKYKESRRKEDRRLYRLLSESFLPEIAEMFRYPGFFLVYRVEDSNPLKILYMKKFVL